MREDPGGKRLHPKKKDPRQTGLHRRMLLAALFLCVGVLASLSLGALAQQPRWLVMDEPTSHLDYGNENRVLGQVKKLAGLGYTIIMITHVPGHAFLCADKVLAVGRGVFFAEGNPDAVLTEETLSTLYGVDIQLSEVALRRDQRHVKVCVPITI